MGRGHLTVRRDSSDLWVTETPPRTPDGYVIVKDGWAFRGKCWEFRTGEPLAASHPHCCLCVFCLSICCLQGRQAWQNVPHAGKPPEKWRLSPPPSPLSLPSAGLQDSASDLLTCVPRMPTAVPSNCGHCEAGSLHGVDARGPWPFSKPALGTRPAALSIQNVYVRLTCRCGWG